MIPRPAVGSLAVVLLAMASCSAAQASDPPSLESELRNALSERWAALARNDAVAYGATLDDGFVTPDFGLLYDKKAMIERARNIKERSSEPREVQVHGDDHAAIMVYRTTSHTPIDGMELSEELRIVESYVKRNGRWLLTARAETEIPNANRVAVAINSDTLKDYVGEYEIRPGQIVKITRQGGRLFEQGPDDPSPVEDLPLSSNAFFQREQPGVLIFTRSADGKVDSYVLWIFDGTVVGKKVK